MYVFAKLPTLRTRRTRVVKNIVKPSNRHYPCHLESIYFKFCENWTKTLSVNVENVKSDDMTPVTLTFDLDLYKSIDM